MKKLLVSAIIALSLFACNSAEEKTKTSEPPEQKKNAALDNPDYDAGLNLIAKSDCFTCHKLRETHSHVVITQLFVPTIWMQVTPLQYLAQGQLGLELLQHQQLKVPESS